MSSTLTEQELKYARKMEHTRRKQRQNAHKGKLKRLQGFSDWEPVLWSNEPGKRTCSPP